MEEKGIKVKEHQTALGVNFTVAGIIGLCVFDEETLLYYPVPKEYFSIFIEQYMPGVKFDSDLTVTVKAATTTGSKSATAPAGSIFYVEKVVIGTVPEGVTGKYTVKIGDVEVVKDATLASDTTIDIVSLFGNRFRANKIEVSVTLDTAPTADTDIPITATVIQKAVAF
jgi:hypothetical protein